MQMPRGTAMVMKQAAMGPAAISARMARAGARLVGGGVGVDTMGAARIIAQGAGGPSMLKGLGDTAPLKQVGSTAIGAGAKVAGASIATYAGAGSWAGPIGIAVGAIAGVLVTKLLNKQYLNVNELNAGEDARVAAFNQYRNIAGQVSGRNLGLPTMEAIWEGANYSGLFSANNKRQCYHQGCSKYNGDPSWISGAIHGGAGTGAFSFPYAFAQMQKAGVFSRPVQPVARMTQTPVMFRAGGGPVLRGNFAGFGQVPQSVGVTPEAVILIDNYFIPNNRADSPAWAIPSNALEHQLLYDVADAWLATQPVQTIEFVANGGTLAPNTPGTVTSADPTQGGKVAPVPPTGQVIPPSTGGPGGSGPGAAYDLVPVTNPATGQTSYVINPNNPTAVSPVLKTAGPLTAGLSNIPSSVWLVLLAGMALAFPLYKEKSS
jgi:hypothetical protein